MSARSTARRAARLLVALPALTATLAVASGVGGPAPALVVQFEGGTVGANVSRVVGDLVRGGYVTTKALPLAPGEGLCDVYTKKAKLPGNCTKAMLGLAASLNPGASSRGALPAGTMVKAPAVDIVAYEYTVLLDPRVTADRKRAEELKTFWKGQLQREEKAANGAQLLVFRGYRLVVSVADDAKLAQLVAALRLHQSPNVVLSPVYARPRAEKFYSSTEEFWNACIAGRPLAGPALDLGALVGAPSTRCATRCQAAECSDVVIIDTAIETHPDLQAALGGTPSSTAYAPRCRPDFDEQVHHGTHLAGIVAADAGDGRIRGIDPGARITGVVRDAGPLGDINVAEDMQARPVAPLPIYLFASRWRARSCRAAGQGNPIAMRACSLRPLLIAAAGDEDQQITTAFEYGPMNMGNENNVVLVTACTACEPGAVAPRLLAGANWSSGTDRMVHVAAPGVDIPSPVTATEYGRASGTSQAAAFVAGLASAMHTCHPDAYTWPHLVKTRLQATSRPFPPVASGPRPDDGLAAGIVDAEAALRDPREDWIRRKGSLEWEAARIRGWRVPDLSVLHPVSRGLVGPAVRSQDVLRVVRHPPAEAAQDVQWTLYSRVAWDNGLDHQGEVVRTGPGLLADTTSEALELCDGTKLPLDDLADVLVALLPHRCAP